MNEAILIAALAVSLLHTGDVGYTADFGGQGCSILLWSRGTWRYVAYNTTEGTLNFYGVTFEHRGNYYAPYIYGPIDWRDCVLTGWGNFFFSCGYSAIAVT